MNSVGDHPDGWGFPIRKSPDQCVLATPRSLSQPITSFIASQCQGIRQTPLLCLISLCQRSGDSHRRLGSFRAGDDPHYVNGLLPFPTTPPRRRNPENLDFKDLILQMNDVKERQLGTAAPRVLCRALSRACDGGGRRDRTDDLLLAKQALSQLSYAPVLRTPVSIAISLRFPTRPHTRTAAQLGGPGRI